MRTIRRMSTRSIAKMRRSALTGMTMASFNARSTYLMQVPLTTT
jgi:hypothetical protein